MSSLTLMATLMARLRLINGYCRRCELRTRGVLGGNCRICKWQARLAQGPHCQRNSSLRESMGSDTIDTREHAKSDVFDYIEVFYNRTRRHSYLAGVSPEAFEHASNAAL